MSYKAGIVLAITELKDRTGSSMPAIKKHMQAKLPKDKKWLNGMFLKALKAGVASGDFVQVKGSYKLSADFKKKSSKSSSGTSTKPKKKAAAAPKKKASSTAKKSTTKKKSSTTKKKSTTTKKKSSAPKKKSATKKKSTTKPKKTTTPKKVGFSSVHSLLFFVLSCPLLIFFSNECPHLNPLQRNRRLRSKYRIENRLFSIAFDCFWMHGVTQNRIL